MKQTSKDKIINESLNEKIEAARALKSENKHWQAIEAYHKAVFLKEDPQYLFQLAQIYEQIMDMTSASLFYRRTHQLNNSSLALQKVKNIAKIQGLQLLAIGSVKNILQETQFESFSKRYNQFHRKMMSKIAQKSLFSDYLQSALAFLQVNQRQLALSEVENCLMIDQHDVDWIVLRAMLYWSLYQTIKGYRQFWNAYSQEPTHPEVQMFIQMITPQVQQLYKEAKYDLIDRKLQKCRAKVKKGLQIHPYHTQLLILSAYLHRTKEEYEMALSDLQLANKHIEDQSLEAELRSQISLTYNQMGIYLFKQNKYSQACKLFTQGLTFNDKDWGMLTNRGDCYRASSDFLKALEDYLRAHQIQKALEDYLRAHQIQKKNQQLNFRIASIYSIRGVALFNSKNFDLALKEFEEAIVFSPRCPQFHLSRAKTLLQMNRKHQAVESLQKCLQLDDKLVEASQMLGQVREPEQRKGKNNRKIIMLSKEK